MGKKVFAFILSLLLCAASLCGCMAFGAKTAATPEQFQSVASAQGFAVSTVDPLPEGAVTVLAAQSPDGEYEIQYARLEDETYAKSYFESAKATFQKLIPSGGVRKSINMSEYGSFSLQNAAYYCYTSWVGDTLLFVSAPAASQEEAVAFLQALENTVGGSPAGDGISSVTV